MNVKFNPHVPMAMPGTPSASETALSARTMAPVSLTPLPPPASSAPVVRVAVSQVPGPALDYSAFFTAHRDALLDRLISGGTASDRGPAGGLPASHRSACVELVKALALAADTRRNK